MKCGIRRGGQAGKVSQCITSELDEDRKDKLLFVTTHIRLPECRITRNCSTYTFGCGNIRRVLLVVFHPWHRRISNTGVGRSSAVGAGKVCRAPDGGEGVAARGR